MSAANLGVLGFAAAVRPNWVFKVYGVVPIRVSWVVVGAWLFEAVQYWRGTEWDKIQSASDGHLMGILVGVVGGVVFRRMYRGKLLP